jgi:hypothetical protein
MEWSEMAKAIEDFKSAAWMTFAAGMCTAASQAFSGAMTLGSAGAGAKALKGAPKGQDASLTAQQARIKSAGWDAASGFGQSIGTLGSSGFNFGASMFTASEKTHEAESKKFSSMADMAADFQRSQIEAAKKVLDALSSMLDTDFQTKQKIIA